MISRCKRSGLFDGLLTLVSILAVFLVQGCAGDNEGEAQLNSTSVLEAMIVDSVWNLSRTRTDAGEERIPNVSDGARYTIEFSQETDDGVDGIRRVTGVHVCSNYVGQYVLEESVLSLFGVTQEDVSCGDAAFSPEALMFSRVLIGTTISAMMSVDDNTLTITSGANEQLTFIRSDGT